MSERLKTHSKTQKKSADLVSNKLRIGVFQRYQMKCKSVSKKSPRYKREKEGLTLSYIKNVIWQAERGLGQETPVESLLTQYQDARAQKQNTDALEKQINERLEGVLSRWLLLKNNVMPEAATGTTAEK